MTAVIPAHNEADHIAETIHALQKQVDEVVVACDNCTDETFDIAQEAGATAFNTVDNEHRKAGALNQALENFIDWDIGDQQYIFICDADTTISKNWIKRAQMELKYVSKGGEYDAVGSVFEGDANQDQMIQFCQQMEWFRYTNQVQRSKKVFVLTGTASIISATALQKVKAKNGYFYDESSITQDFTMTLDLKAVGAKLISPVSCRCTTELMPTWKLLFLQRRRWYLGALQQVFARKWDKILLPYLFQQFMLAVSVISYIGVLVFTGYLMLQGWLVPNLIWSVIGLVFIVERVVTVWNYGKGPRWFAGLMLPEMFYNLILQFAYIGAVWQLITRSSGTWNHVNE